MEKRVKCMQKPSWLTEDIGPKLTERDKLLKVASNKKDKTDYKRYKAARNKINNLIHTAKRNYYMEALNKNIRNSKILWQHMRSTIQTASNIGLKLTKQNNDQSPVNVGELANEFNKHFGNITNQYKPQLTSV